MTIQEAIRCDLSSVFFSTFSNTHILSGRFKLNISLVFLLGYFYQISFGIKYAALIITIAGHPWQAVEFISIIR